MNHQMWETDMIHGVNAHADQMAAKRHREAAKMERIEKAYIDRERLTDLAFGFGYILILLCAIAISI